MKNLVIVCSLVAVSSALIANAQDKKPHVMRVQRDPATAGMDISQKIQYHQMKRYGGIVYDTRKQKGCIRIVNAQKVVDKSWYDPIFEQFVAEEIRLRFEVAEGSFSLPTPKVEDGVAALFVVDDPAMPMSLVAPESHWAMMNVAPLKSGEGAKPQFFKARVQKMAVRILCHLMGAANSQYPMCLTGCITKPADLDRYVDIRLPVDVLEKLPKYVAGYGITPSVRSTYKKSVYEGWAAAPTNEFQKAIWDAIHTLPTKPITIEPEKK